ncbi:hypothetical protein SK128_026158 [Halocaridina rubra]|uniref:Uncharacterized protein n=1 Tax=Halocaridina rubra TaxID=373956 RepID=A0AAN8WXE2_HALRR
MSYNFNTLSGARGLEIPSFVFSSQKMSSFPYNSGSLMPEQQLICIAVAIENPPYAQHAATPRWTPITRCRTAQSLQFRAIVTIHEAGKTLTNWIRDINLDV